MMHRIIVAAALVLTGCVPGPDNYPIPPQQKAPGAGEEIRSFGEYVKSWQPDAESYFIRHIAGVEAGAWRWTHSDPELRFFVKDIRDRRFKLEIGVNDVTFRDTGPLRLSIFINGKEFDRVVYDSPGDKSYEKAVPPDMLRQKAENRVLIRVLNPWDTTDPKIKLGFILHEAGFL